MPIYRATHDCGYVNEVFLKADKQNIEMQCKRCGRKVSAHQVRDKNAEFKGRNEVMGVFKHEGTKT